MFCVVSLFLCSIGCKHDLVTAHLTIKNKDPIDLKDIVFEFDDQRQKRLYTLNENVKVGHNFAKLPRKMNSLKIRWKEGEDEKSAEIKVPPIPKSNPPPEVVITYAEGLWNITVGYEFPH